MVIEVVICNEENKKAPEEMLGQTISVLIKSFPHVVNGNPKTRLALNLDTRHAAQALGHTCIHYVQCGVTNLQVRYNKPRSSARRMAARRPLTPSLL